MLRDRQDQGHGRRSIVFIPSLAARGGAEKFAVELASALVGRGDRVALAAEELDSLQPIGEYFDVDLSAVELLRLPTLRKLSGLRPRSLSAGLKEATWAAVLMRWRPTLFVNAQYKSELALPGLRNVIVCHFPHPPRASMPVPPGRLSAVQWVVRRATRAFPPASATVLANSQFTREHVRRRWHVDAAVLYPPCAAVPQPAGAQPGNKIVSVGRFVAPQPNIPNKRFDVMVDAFAEMTDLHDQGWEFHLVGSAPEGAEEYLQQLASRAGAAPVFLHPNADVDELRALLWESSIYWHAQGYGSDANVHPEAMEHFGMSLVEALSAGCLPVVYGEAGPKEIVAPVAGARTWHTVDELCVQTRAAVALSPEERRRAASSAQKRAAEFALGPFTEAAARLV